jgi:ABC-type dipeptide/oligopeptide/nickel transport system permease component
MMPTSSRSTIGVAVFALLAVVDISWVIQAWSGLLGSADAPASAVLVLFALVGAVTVGTVLPAQRGYRTAAWIMAGSRVVSVLLIGLPGYVLGAPGWVLAIASVAILLTALGLWWTAPLLSRAGAASVATRSAS